MTDGGIQSPFDRALETYYLTSTGALDAPRCATPERSADQLARLLPQVRPDEDVDLDRSNARDVNHGALSVLNAAIRRAMLLGDTPMANVQLLDPDHRFLRLTAHSGFPGDFLGFFATVGDTSSACGSAFATGQPTWIGDVRSSIVFDRTPALEVILDAGIRAVGSVPIRAPNGWVIGMLSIHHPEPRRWTARQKLEIQRLAGLTGRLLDHLTQLETG